MPKSDKQVSDHHRLDKSLFAAGLQCAKRLYQEFHQPDSLPAANEMRKTLAAIGQQLTEMAWEGFPRGERIEDEDHQAAVAHTQKVLDDESGAAIFDAAFEFQGVEIRCDVVLPSRSDKTVDIFEVKSGTKVKPRHVMDVALQMWVIESCGFTVRSASLLHLDAEFRHDGSKNYPVHKFFKNADVTKKARKRKARISDYIDSFQTLLDDESTLELPTGTWCLNPIPCGYAAQCRKQAPDNPLMQFPDLTPAQESAFHQLGVETIDQIDPATEGLTPVQQRVLKAYAEGGLVIDSFVAEEFETLIYPVCFVVTETALQVMPKHDRSRPWQHVPYLWDARVLHEDGTVEHRSFLATDKDDPRPSFAKSLSACIDDVGTVVTWSKRLDGCLRQLMEDLPDVKSELRTLVHMDPLGLDALTRNSAYHPAQAGAFDRGAVHAAFTGKAPTTASIRDEEDARAAYEKIANSRTRQATRDKLRPELSEYGARESQAMLDIFKALRGK